MGTFDVQHPDVFDFIKAKREDGRLRQFNLSLLITREFMEAVIRDEKEFPLVFPYSRAEASTLGDLSNVYWRKWAGDLSEYIVNDQGLVACKIYKTVPVKELWDTIMESTYDFAEPGFILIDEVNDMNNNWFCENIRATNPCGKMLASH